jgi:hypothetical protein
LPQTIANKWYRIHHSRDPAAAEEHNHFIHRQKKLGAMDPNAKLVFEEFVKQFREEIHDSFTVHESIINNRLSEFEQAGQWCEERVASLKSITVSFEEWKPKVDSSLTYVKLELSKLNSFFDCDAKASSFPKPDVLPIGSTSASPSIGINSDGPNGHCSNTIKWDCGYGCVYTQTHDPIKGTLLHPPPPNSPSRSTSKPCSDPFAFTHQSGQGHKCCMGKLPKIKFSKFDGENPRLWKSRSENYFDMYAVELDVWVRVATMHFESPAARWLQSVHHLIRCAT